MASLTQSTGVPVVCQASLTPSTEKVTGSILRMPLMVTACPMPLWARSGATTTTSPWATIVRASVSMPPA